MLINGHVGFNSSSDTDEPKEEPLPQGGEVLSKV